MVLTVRVCVCVCVPYLLCDILVTFTKEVNPVLLWYVWSLSCSVLITMENILKMNQDQQQLISELWRAAQSLETPKPQKHMFNLVVEAWFCNCTALFHSLVINNGAHLNMNRRVHTHERVRERTVNCGNCGNTIHKSKSALPFILNEILIHFLTQWTRKVPCSSNVLLLTVTLHCNLRKWKWI